MFLSRQIANLEIWALIDVILVGECGITECGAAEKIYHSGSK